MEQRLTKTEAQLGEAVWNYGELKREQLANQQKTSGSPINTSAALEAKDEPVPVAIVEVFGKDWRLDYMALPVGKHKLYAQQYTYTTPPQRKPLTDEEIDAILIGLMRQHKSGAVTIARAIEAAHGIKGEA